MPAPDDIPRHDETEAHHPLDRGLAPPTEDPEITSTHPLDRGLAPPDEPDEEPENGTAGK